MLETLNSIDQALFLYINVTLANAATDTVMPVVTADNFLRFLYGAAMAMLLIKGNARLRWLVLFSAVALLLTDQLASSVLKPLIARPRPCHVLADIHLLVGCGGGKAMPSSHAANAFGQAALFALAAPRWRWYLWGFASVVALSRVFVGVHYVGDVLVGAMLGMVIGVSVAWAFGWFAAALVQRRAKRIADAPAAEAGRKMGRD